MRRALIFFALILITGCLSSVSVYELYKSINLGMSPEEIIKIAGEPSYKTEIVGYELWFYSKMTGVGYGHKKFFRDAVCLLKNAKVVYRKVWVIAEMKPLVLPRPVRVKVVIKEWKETTSKSDLKKDIQGVLNTRKGVQIGMGKGAVLLIRGLPDKSIKTTTADITTEIWRWEGILGDVTVIQFTNEKVTKITKL